MINKLKQIRLRTVVKFVAWFFATYFVVELIELSLAAAFPNASRFMNDSKWLAMILFVVIYLFKFHILCCVVPFLVATYRCRHKKCHHDHCEPGKAQ